MRMVEVLSVKNRGLSERRYAECTTEAKEHTKHAKHPEFPGSTGTLPSQQQSQATSGWPLESAAH